MFRHRPTRAQRSASRKRRAIAPFQRRYRGLNLEALEERVAPAVQVFSGLEFLTAGAFAVNNNVVTSSSPVEVGVAPASGGAFTPLLQLQDGIQFNNSDATGTFTTPPSGGPGGAVDAYEGGSLVPLLDAQQHTFEAPALLGPNYDVLPGTDTNHADLAVAGGDLTVTALRFNGPGLDVQGNLSFADFVGLSLAVDGANYVALSSTGAALTGLSVALAGPIGFTEAGMGFSVTNLQATYSAINNEFALSGDANLSVAGTTFDLDLGGASGPGLVIQNGALESLDASITGSFTVGGLSFAAQDLTFQYNAATSTYAVSGGASFSLAGATVDIVLGGGNTAGLVIAQGQLTSLDATVTGQINDLLGIDLKANGLTVSYVAANGDFALYGGVSLTSGFLNFSTTLGTDRDHPGILVEGGKLESLDISVSGGFSLFGIQVQADGLTIDYDEDTSSLELAGGITLDFTSVFEVSAAISKGGLFINTSTGALSVPSSGLQITAGATIGPFSIQDLMISFSNGPGGVNFSASGKVALPGGFDVDLTQLVIQNGQLDDIGLSESGSIPIGDTGFFLDGLSGSLDNLNNLSQIAVSASAEVSFGKTVTIPNISPIFGGGTFSLVDAKGSITVNAGELDLSGSVSLVGGLLGQGSASLDLNWTTGVYMVSGNFSMYDDIFNFGGSLTITNAGDITLLAMASVNVPPQIPFIGGDSLGSVNFFLQYEAGQDPSQDVVAAWTSINLFAFSITIGFEINFDGDLSIINGNDAAALTAADTTQAPTQYVYQDDFGVPADTVAGTVPSGAQVTVSSPILDGAYPVSVYPLSSSPSSTTISANFSEFSGHYFTDYQLAQSNVILSTLSFGVTIEQDVVPGGVFVGTGSFNAQGQFVFKPSGNTSLVPTGATLYSSGLLVLQWPGAPYGSYTSSISPQYDASDVDFELLQQSSSGTPIPLAEYSIDPVSNDPNDPVQSAMQADLMESTNDVPGNITGGEGGSGIETQYTLVDGQAVPQSVSFSLYRGSTLLGNGSFDAGGNFHFAPVGTPRLVPDGGSLSTNIEGDGILTLHWPTSPDQTAINVSYIASANRLIDFQLSNESSPNGTAGQYIIELVDKLGNGNNGPLSPDAVPMFSATTLYQAPTVSFAPGSLAVSSTGVLSGTLLANAYDPAAQGQGGSKVTVSLYYNTTDSTTEDAKTGMATGQLIDTYDYNDNGSGGPLSYQFSWPGFANLPTGPYYLYAVIDDGMNPPVTSAVLGPFNETSPAPVLSSPSDLALSGTGGSEAGVFSAADGTALGITTNFDNPVTVDLSLSGGGDLVLGSAAPAAQITQTFASAADAVAALDGLAFESDGSFDNTATLTFAVSTTLNGTTYSASNTIPLLTPNTPLTVSQTVDATVPSSPDEFNLTLAVTNNSDGPDGQDGTDVQVRDELSPGLSVLSSTASEGQFDASTGLWTIGDLPTTGANSATLTLVLQADPSTQGQALTSSAQASSMLFNYPASRASNVVAVARPGPITLTVTNLNDGGAGSLRAALQAAENGDTIVFSQGLAGTIVLTSGELLINQDVTIIGPTTSTGAPAVTISGNQSSRVFDIQGGASGANVSLEDLAIENGLAGAAALNTASAGGGLLVNDAGGAVALSNVFVSGNAAQGSAGAPAQGGGIAFLDGIGTFTDDTFSNNSATAASGGAATGGALAVVAGNVTLINDTVAENTASDGDGGSGGGIAALAGSLTLSNDTIADNAASRGGDVDQTAPAFVEALNTVFASATTATGAPDFDGAVGHGDHNLVDNTAGSTGFSALNGDVLNVGADLAPLGENGGPLPTMPPLAGSPAINAGDSGLSAAKTIPGLVGYWRGDGNANDATGANNATLEGGAAYGPGEGGTTGFALNGTSAFVQTAAGPAGLSINDAISVSALVDPTSFTNDSVIIDKTESGDLANYRFGLYGDGSLFFFNGSTAVFSSGKVPLNTFSQVGFTLDGATDSVSFYINGQLDSNQLIALGAPNTGPVWIGHDPAGGYFQGTIQDVAVYHAVLTNTQMSSLAGPPAVVAEAGGPIGVPGLVSLIGVRNGAARDLAGANYVSANTGVTYGPGAVGQAMVFDGASGTVTVTDGPTLDTPAFTISGWFHVAEAPASGATADLADKSDGDGHGWSLSLDSGLGLSFSLWSSTADTVTATFSQPLSLNAWHEIAATFDGATATLFIDGAAVATATLPGGYTAAATPLVLGAASLPGGDNFNGAIDDFAFFNIALTAAQVRGLGATGSVGAELATTANLADFYAGQGNALDTAGDNDGTIVGGVSYAPGAVGRAFSFNGQGSDIALGDGPDIVGTGPFTVAVWVNTTATGTEFILNQRDPNNYNGEYVLGLDNGSVNFFDYGNNEYGFNLTTRETVNDGAWHLIVAQRLADGTGQIFIDGALAGSQAGAPVPLGSGFGVYIGEDVRDAVDVGPAYDYNYMGLLEGVQIYDTALSASRIAALQNSLGLQIAANTDERGGSRRVGGDLDIGADQYQYDLSLTGSAPSSVAADDQVVYTLNATNNGPDSVTGATLVDDLPSGVVFESLTAPSGWNISAPAVGQGGAVTATDGAALPPGGSAQFELVGSITSAALNETDIDNTATIGPAVADATPESSTLSLVTDVPNGLGLLSQPTRATAGSPMAPAIAINVVDNSNNTVAADDTQRVTLSIASGPAGAVLRGTTTVVAVNGVATFSGLSVNLAGTYVLVATGGDLTPVDTNPIQVAPVVVTNGLSIRRSRPRLLRRPGHAHSRARAHGHGRARIELVREKIVIENTGRSALNGPLALQVNGLRPGYELVGPSGSYGGAPYREVLPSGEPLAPNHRLTVDLEVNIQGKAPRDLRSIFNNIEALLDL